MGSSVKLAEMGRKVPGIELRRAARRSRETRAEYWRGFVVSSFFIVVIGANLMVGAAVMFGAFRAHTNAETAALSHKTARVMRPLLDGTFCRTMVFDNTTAQSITDKVERCDRPFGEPVHRGKSHFSWGGN